MTTAVTDATMI